MSVHGGAQNLRGSTQGLHPLKDSPGEAADGLDVAVEPTSFKRGPDAMSLDGVYWNNGLWTFTSPLEGNEACDPEVSSLRFPPSGLSAELIVSCGN